MKKTVLALILLLEYLLSHSQVQVSEEFYANFKKAVSKKTEVSGFNFYQVLNDVALQCFDLNDGLYIKEIRRFNDLNISDSAAVAIIPSEVMERFLNNDYEMLFCKNLKSYQEISKLNSDYVCACITPDYSKLSRHQKTESLRGMLVDCLKKINSNEEYVQAYRQKVKDTSSLDGIQSCTAAYIYLHCPVLRDELNEIPENSAWKNNLKKHITNQCSNTAERFKQAIRNNDLSGIASLFLDSGVKSQFEKQYTQFKNEIDTYRSGQPSEYIDWGAESIAQTFVLQNKPRTQVVFGIVYHFKIIHTELKISRTEFLKPTQIKNRQAIIDRMSAPENSPGVIDPMGKPAPPIPDKK